MGASPRWVIVAVWALTLCVLVRWNSQVFAAGNDALMEDYLFEARRHAERSAQLVHTFEKRTLAVEDSILKLATSADELFAALSEEERGRDKVGSTQRRLAEFSTGGSAGEPLSAGWYEAMETQLSSLYDVHTLMSKLRAKAEDLSSSDDNSNTFLQTRFEENSHSRVLIQTQQDATDAVNRFVGRSFVSLFLLEQYWTRITQFRDAFQPMIAAIESRSDHMLYNYI